MRKSSKDAEEYKTARRKSREKFQKASKLEQEYLKKIRQVVRQIDSVVKGLAPEGRVKDVEALRATLARYSEMLRPWARSVAERMIAEISQKDEKAWRALGKLQGRLLAEELATAPTGAIYQSLMDEQVKYITSLPLDAADRVHKLVTQGLQDSTRASEVAKEIMRTGEVTLSRARLIARTEVARAASVLTQARSEHIGATHYVWRTAGDSDVRHSHRQMNGKVFAWAEPPTLSDGTVTHPGQIYNCRCYPEPILPEE